MILLLATASSSALAGLTASITPPPTYRTDRCLELQIEVHNPSELPSDVALSRSVVQLHIDGRRVESHFTSLECDGRGPRAILAPGETRIWTFVHAPVLLPRGRSVLHWTHPELGGHLVPIEVEWAPELDPAWVASRHLTPRDTRFRHSVFVPDLIALARQGLGWSAAALARMDDDEAQRACRDLEDHPVLSVQCRSEVDPGDWRDWLEDPQPAADRLARAGLLEGSFLPEIAQHYGVSRLDGHQLLMKMSEIDPSVPSGPFIQDPRRELGAAFHHAPPLPTAALISWLETDARFALGVVAGELRDRSDPEVLPALLDRASACDHRGVLRSARIQAFHQRRRPDVFPVLLKCLKDTITHPTARAGLLHYIAWGRTGSCPPFAGDDPQSAWVRLFETHRQTIQEGRQLPTYAEGVEEAAKSFGCEVAPSATP